MSQAIPFNMPSVNHSKAWGAVAALAFAGLGLAASASAAPVAPGPDAAGFGVQARHVEPIARARMVAWIDAYRTTNPGAFAAVAAVTGCRPETYLQLRKPGPNCASELRALGPGVVPALVDALAFHVPPDRVWSAPERKAWAFGLLLATGTARDGRATPVLAAVLERGADDAALQQAAAEALGRIGGDTELELLLRHARAGAKLEAAALAGLGTCARVEAVRHLARALDAKPSTATAETIAVALGSVASDWAWQARARAEPAPAAHGLAVARGLEVRSVALLAAAKALPQWTGAVRDRLIDVLAMAAHPDTGKVVVQLKGRGDPELNAALDAFLRRSALP
ncbi:MAG: hypothetical protein EXR79_14575 [Myxococcales bacterium]|nr:hypothetical protein [Myxococcales bacterium]